jgi:hypothetical protein
MTLVSGGCSAALRVPQRLYLRSATLLECEVSPSEIKDSASDAPRPSAKYPMCVKSDVALPTNEGDNVCIWLLVWSRDDNRRRVLLFVRFLLQIE